MKRFLQLIVILFFVLSLSTEGGAESKFWSKFKSKKWKKAETSSPVPPVGVGGDIPEITPIVGDMQQHTDTKYKGDQDAGDFDPDVSPDGKWLVYSSTANSKNRQLFLKSVDGKVLSALTGPGISCIHPKFHPQFDGVKNKKIAFASNGSGNSWDIWVMNDIDQGFKSAFQLTHTEENECHPSWSPDGERIVYSGWDSMKKDYMIYILDVKTEQIHPLNIDGLFPEWCPSSEMGKKDLIVFQRARRRGVRWYSIWTIYADGTRRRILIPGNDNWAAITPSWSPDGDWVAYASVHLSPSSRKERRIFRGDDIWVIRLDGTVRTRFTNDPAPESTPCWAPKVGNKNENGRIFFCSMSTGYRNIWSLMPYLNFNRNSKNEMKETAVIEQKINPGIPAIQPDRPHFDFKKNKTAPELAEESK